MRPKPIIHPIKYFTLLVHLAVVAVFTYMTVTGNYPGR